jgi:hypothetical protein
MSFAGVQVSGHRMALAVFYERSGILQASGRKYKPLFIIKLSKIKNS